MGILKCKMCGGDLEIAEGASTAECTYCGSVQTIPNLDDEKKLIQFERAERLRKQCEFDNAAGIYETIVADFRQEAEAYWGLVLCKYGIEYVDDPATGKKIPTCHRSSFESVMEDADFEQTLENADSFSRRVYREEAKAIEELRKGIIAVSVNEAPYDIFICYKETAENGDRTLDSVLAQDVYDALTQRGYRVFFSRITLEDKLGMEYEPYIFAALNSAKIMLAFGTDYDYFNAVWVKNEWGRFLKLMAKDKEKHLIPCYKGIDAYDMPKEFAKLQAQDLGKVGALQDLLRGIEKLMPKKEPQSNVQETVVVQQAAPGGNPSVDSYIKRAFLFLEDGDWNSANEYCEKVLDIDPENASAYLGKLLAQLKVKKQAALKDCAEPFDHNGNYQKILRFGSDALKAELTGYIEHIHTRNENARLDGIYTRAKNAMSAANTESAYKAAAHLFESIRAYQNSASLADECYEKAEAARKDAILSAGKANMTGQIISKYESAIKLFESISGWKDADEKIYACQKKIEEIKAKEEAKRLEEERQAEIARKEAERQAEIARKEAERIAKRNKRIAIITTPIVCAIIAFVIVLNAVIIPNNKYNDAIALMDAGKYAEAIVAFEAMDGYKDSADKIWECKYSQANALMESEKYKEAIFAWLALVDYKDSNAKLREAWNQGAVRETISASNWHTVGLKADGTVVAVGENDYGQCDVSGWKNIVAISASDRHTVGLKADGTVVAVGDNDYGQCDVSGWENIVAISAGGWHTVGLKADGTVVAVGNDAHGRCDVSGWENIVAITAGGAHTVGLKADGTVVAVGNNAYGQCVVYGWTDIVAISANGSHTVGLKADGTVVAVGYDDDGRCKVSGWENIVAISAGGIHTVGLKADGTVVAVGQNGYGQCNVSGWENIVAITAGGWHTVGLKADGTVVVVGYSHYGQRDMSGWENIKIPANAKD